MACGWTRTLRRVESLPPKLRKEDAECRGLLLHFEVKYDLFCEAQEAVAVHWYMAAGMAKGGWHTWLEWDLSPYLGEMENRGSWR